MSTKYSGSDWLKENLAREGREISPLGETVADVLGQVWQGIYHNSKAVLNKKVNWSNKTYIVITIAGGLNSYDFMELTALLVLCFDNMLRLEINPKSFDYLELVFHPRKSRMGRIDERLPTIETVIDDIREHLSLDDGGEVIS